MNLEIKKTLDLQVTEKEQLKRIERKNNEKYI